MAEPLTARDMTPGEREAWQIATSRGLNISRADLRDLREAGGYEPRRDDDVARWLKRWRDHFVVDGGLGTHHQTWLTLDSMLDDYRLHADTGTPLDDDVTDDEGVPL